MTNTHRLSNHSLALHYLNARGVKQDAGRLYYETVTSDLIDSFPEWNLDHKFMTDLLYYIYTTNA